MRSTSLRLAPVLVAAALAGPAALPAPALAGGGCAGAGSRPTPARAARSRGRRSACSIASAPRTASAPCARTRASRSPPGATATTWTSTTSSPTAISSAASPRRLLPRSTLLDGRGEHRLGRGLQRHAAIDRLDVDAQPRPPREHPQRPLPRDRRRTRGRRAGAARTRGGDVHDGLRRIDGSCRALHLRPRWLRLVNNGASACPGDSPLRALAPARKHGLRLPRRFTLARAGSGS